MTQTFRFLRLQRAAVMMALSLVGLMPAVAASAQDSQPVADPAAVVVVGHARFTVLTSQLVRLEWAEDGQFEDRPSLVFINRRLPVPTFSTRTEGGGTIIDTGRLRLRYRPDGAGEFHPDNLSIRLTVAGQPVTWHPVSPRRATCAAPRAPWTA